MIYGVGQDLVEIPRIERALARFGERFARRILCEPELARFRRHRLPAAFLAKRFAAKEALGKALGIGVRAPATLPAIAVVHDAYGKPEFSYAPALAAYMAERGLTAHLSLSDERDYAVAFVVVEKA
jgi:holo-[acyl-carrier protein] synthase